MLVVSLAALAPAGAAATTTWLVDMDNSYTFHPKTKAIARGDKVKWRNKQSLQHDVQSDLSGYFTSPGGKGGLGEDETYTKTFKQAGTFGYICRFHRNDGMQGTIVVPIKVTLNGSTFTITVASASASGKWRNRDPGPQARRIELVDHHRHRGQVGRLALLPARHVPVPLRGQGYEYRREVRLEPDRHPHQVTLDTRR